MIIDLWNYGSEVWKYAVRGNPLSDKALESRVVREEMLRQQIDRPSLLSWGHPSHTLSSPRAVQGKSRLQARNV